MTEPAWVEHAVWWHVYPLGFVAAEAAALDRTTPAIHRLPNIALWLDYLVDLGASGLLLGPVFESSTHGYDTVDYFRIDRRLGDDDDFAALVEQAHERGVRVLLDGVFNHVGRDFWAFRDVLANGANSAYRDWFAGLRFDGRSPFGDPFVYEGWAGHFDLVKLDLGNSAVREHVFGAVESWIRDFDIDGLRLDAADVVDLEFQRALAGLCRGIKPDFWLVGEVVHGDYRRWVNPQTLDGDL